jgi:TetR/AcrR family transcriptional regulator, tetracycline repressor protein
MVLRRADVVEGALELLDVEGLDGLTMRKLSAALNVQGGALYRHFPSKEALLDAMAERLLAGVGAPLPPGRPWPDQCRELAGRLHAALLARRDGARVVAGTFVPSPNTAAAGDQAIQVLCAAGFPPETAGWLTFAVFYYVLGHTIEEQGQSRLGPGDDWSARLAASGTGLADPAASAMRATAAADPGARFRFGLEVFLAGAARQLEELNAGRGEYQAETGAAARPA